jgi:hypothetical protein
MRAMRLALVTITMLIACGAPPARPADVHPVEPVTPAPAVSPELSPALVPLAWWLGDWEGDEGSEHWAAAAGAIYGVTLRRDGRWEAMIIDDGEGGGKPDGILRFIAMPNGLRAVEFRKRELASTSITFARDSPDFPNAITYHRDADALAAVVAGGERTASFAWHRAKPARAPELEAADLAFSADTGARGVAGWVAAFDSGGAMMRRGERVEGAAIGETMQGLLSAGRLAWAPIASGRAGELGFTVGKATYTAATPADSWRSTYITMWHHQTDGSWKVLFDTGRAVQED